MAKRNHNTGPAARLPKGFRDTPADEIRHTSRMLATIRRVYESYGFEPLETPAIEYSDALGKFLPDQDRPNAGVFSFQDEDEQWMSLRYDLTAPLARFVAANLDALPKPYRRYAVGPVWRNEKPGPGRFRQFTQFDADTVGTDNVAADAEICMLAADTLEALGVPRGQYVIKVNNRKVLDGLLATLGLEQTDAGGGLRRMTVLRAIDKLDRLGWVGVAQLLGRGRRDESGDYTAGAGLADDAIATLQAFLEAGKRFMPHPAAASDRPMDDMASAEGGTFMDATATLEAWKTVVAGNVTAMQGVEELLAIVALCEAAGYGSRRINIDPSCVRGLEYYTGPVFEAELTFEVMDDAGRPVRFGSVGGGGRYDGLVERFGGQKVPATGFSLGVSRLQAALAALPRSGAQAHDGAVVVLVMEKDRISDYQKLTQSLRRAGIPAEMYLGTAGIKAQMRYADKRGAPCVIIQGGDERAKGEVQIKDLIEGAKAAASIKDSKSWREARPAQVCVKKDALIAAVREVLARHRG
jgi:histidyl-tRNA synthetase